MTPFKNILVVVDASSDQHHELEQAVKLAEGGQATLTVVDVVPEFSWTQKLLLAGTDKLRELLAQEKAKQVRKLVSALRKRGVSAKGKVLIGRSATEIIRQVLRGKHDLVVRYPKGERSRRAGFLGSTGLDLLRKCPCAVWLVKPGTTQCERVLAAVDATPDDTNHAALNQLILQAANAVAAAERARLDIVHAWSIYGERLVKDYMKTEEFEQLERALIEESKASIGKLVQPFGLTTESPNVHLLRGEATTEIPRFVAENDIHLLVMGTVARSGVSGMLMGNTAEMILGQIACSVLAIKPAGFISPIKSRAAKPVSSPTAPMPDNA